MKGGRALAAACAAAMLASLGGCYRTVVRDSGTEVGRAPVLHEHLWHHGFVLGIAEFPPAGYRLDRLCPRGWSEIEVRTSVFNAVASAIVGGFAAYNPQTISIRCEATGARYRVKIDERGGVAEVHPERP